MSIIKIYKLRDSKGREIILKVSKFKKNFFSINGKSLKFSFEGFDRTKYLNLIKIVEAYGGEFSEPTEGTIIFSDRKYATGTGQRYNLEYFRDSIIANRLLDLENYKLPLAENHQEVESCDDVENEEAKSEENNRSSNKSFVNQTSSVSGESGVTVDTNTPVTLRSSVNQAENHQAVESCDDAPNEKVILQENDSTLNQSSTRVHQKSIVCAVDTNTPITLRSSVNQNEGKAENHQQDLENCDDAPNEGGKLEKSHGTLNESFATVDQPSIVCAVDTNTPVTTTSSVNQNKEKAENHQDVKSCDDAPNEKVQLDENITSNKSFSKVNRTSPAVTRRSSMNQNKRKLEDEHLNAEPKKRKLRKRNMNFTYDESTIYDFAISPEKMSTRGRRRSLDSLSFLDNPVEHKTSNSSFTEEEDRQIIQYLISKNTTVRDGSQCVWKEMAADLKSLNRSAECLRTHFRIHLRSKYEQYTESVNLPKEFGRLNVDDREKPWKSYSEEEKRKMIQYLIDNKSNARCGMMKIWEKMSADKVIDRSPASLQMHFHGKLRYEYEQYTENAAARKEFEKIIKRKKPETEFPPQRRVRWSKKDNQRIMDYLIENNLIDRVKSIRVWRDVIENVGLGSEYTVFNVLSHFKEHLRHNYWEYTTNPEALRKFAVIAKEKDWY